MPLPDQVGAGFTLRIEGGGEAGLGRGVVGGARAGLDRCLVHAVEEHRWRGKDEEDEHQHANQQDQRLQRNLPVGAHQQRRASLVHRFGGEVSLHLALVGAEVGAEQEERGDGARPEVEAVGHVEAEVEGLHPAGGSSDVQGIDEADAVGQAGDQHHHRRPQPADDDAHLLDVGPGHRLDAADHGIESRRQGDEQTGVGDTQPENHAQDDRRRGDDDAGAHPARDEEQQRREGAGLGVVALLQILVGGENPGLVEERHQRRRQHDHRQRQREVELQEAHALGVALTGGRGHGDRGQLRRHHRQADRPPRQTAAGQQIALELIAGLGGAQSVPHNPNEIGSDDGPVNCRHRQQLGSEVLLNDVEGDQDGDPDHQHPGVVLAPDGHSRLASSRRCAAARLRASRRPCHQASSAASAARDAAIASLVRAGAGPPSVVRISTK